MGGDDDGGRERPTQLSVGAEGGMTCAGGGEKEGEGVRAADGGDTSNRHEVLAAKDGAYIDLALPPSFPSPATPHSLSA